MERSESPENRARTLFDKTSDCPNGESLEDGEFHLTQLVGAHTIQPVTSKQQLLACQASLLCLDVR